MSGPWRRLGLAHQCHQTRALGARATHEIEPHTLWWCSECHRLWRKTSNHITIGRRSVCGCGWALVGEFTNAQALQRFWDDLKAQCAEVGVEGALSSLADITATIRRDRELEH